MTILKLAIKDLRHEWILTLNLILAIAAILAPLLILLGLKYGVISTMRERLVEDPVNREIRPGRTLQLDKAWFETLAQKEEVEFIIPSILRGSSVIRIKKNATEDGSIIDLVPTEKGDPLLLENGVNIPKEGEAVISYQASIELDIKKGDEIIAEVTRTKDYKREKQILPLKIIGILQPRADSLPRIYTPLDLVIDIETYKEGQAVEHRSWPGEQPYPYLSFYKVYVVIIGKLSTTERLKLTINTGFAKAEDITLETFKQTMGFDLPENATIIQLNTIGNSIQYSSIKRLYNQLPGKSMAVLPVAEYQLSYQEKPLKIIGISLSDYQTELLQLPRLPWQQLSDQAVFDYKILLPEGLITEDLTNNDIMVAYQNTPNHFHFPLQVVGTSFSDYAVVPAQLIGILETSQTRKLEYHETKKAFLLSKIGFHGFRLYTKSIDNIIELYQYFAKQDIPVITKVQEIEKVRVLDQGLTRIFWLVAIVGIIGGIAALIASLYASVERKKREIGIMRLMGFYREEVFRFPIFQGMIIVILSVIVAIVFYKSISYLINFVFSSDLQLGEKMAYLPMNYFIYTFMITIVIAIISALLAAWRTTQIDPAEAIRED